MGYITQQLQEEMVKLVKMLPLTLKQLSMRLSKIKLAGFKTFVDPTVLSFPSNLTGIIGPNGCGKSNIVESLRWCMGETSAKSMRGAGMEDVIFSGTSNRPEKNFSEVSLLIDNKDKDGPEQYHKLEEILVKRKIERNKGSKYFLENIFCFISSTDIS